MISDYKVLTGSRKPGFLFSELLFLGRVSFVLAWHCLTHCIIFNKPTLRSKIVVAEELIRYYFHFRKSPENKM